MNNFVNLPITISIPSKEYPPKTYKLIDKNNNENTFKAKSQIDKDFTIKMFQGTQKANFSEFVLSLQGKSNQSSIVNVIDSFDYENNFFLVVEYWEKDLKTLLTQNNQITLLEKLQFSQQIVESIDYLHKNQQFHAKIQLQSFVMIGDRIKLSDFENVNQGDNEISDIKALGCILYELFSGQPYQKQQNQLNDNQQNGLNNLIDKLQVSSKLKQTLKSMQNPQKCPNTKQIIDDIMDCISFQEYSFDNVIHHYRNQSLEQWIQELQQYYEQTSSKSEPPFVFFLQKLQEIITNRQSPQQIKNFGQTMQFQTILAQPQQQNSFANQVKNTFKVLEKEQTFSCIKKCHSNNPVQDQFQDNKFINFQQPLINQLPNNQGQNRPIIQPFQKYEQQHQKTENNQTRVFGKTETIQSTQNFQKGNFIFNMNLKPPEQNNSNSRFNFNQQD